MTKAYSSPSQGSLFRELENIKQALMGFLALILWVPLAGRYLGRHCHAAQKVDANGSGLWRIEATVVGWRESIKTQR